MLDFVQWHPPQERGCLNSLQMEVLATSMYVVIEEWAIRIWSFHKNIAWWFQVINASWYSRLMLRTKVLFGELLLELYHWWLH